MKNEDEIMTFSLPGNKTINISRDALKSIIKDIIIFIIVFACVLLIFKVVKFPQISGSSMNPGLSDGDRVMALSTKDIQVGDIVVVWSTSMNEYIVKRVLGMAGDHIEISDGKFYRNGVQIYEPYIEEQQWGDELVSYTIDIPEDQVFLLGDNRNASTDSRIIGLIPIDDVQMKVVCKADWIIKLKHGRSLPWQKR